MWKKIFPLATRMNFKISCVQSTTKRQTMNFSCSSHILTISAYITLASFQICYKYCKLILFSHHFEQTFCQIQDSREREATRLYCARSPMLKAYHDVGYKNSKIIISFSKDSRNWNYSNKNCYYIKLL